MSYQTGESHEDGFVFTWQVTTTGQSFEDEIQHVGEILNR